MIQTKLKGMGVALITPFKEDESVDYDALISCHLAHLPFCGLFRDLLRQCDGLFVFILVVEFNM